MKNISYKSSLPYIFDILFILGDLVLYLFFSPKQYDFNDQAVFDKFNLLFLAALAAYLFALFFSRSPSASTHRELNGFENISLIANSILIGALMIVFISSSVHLSVFLFILLLFGFMAAYFFAHQRFFSKKRKKAKFLPQILAYVLMLPFVFVLLFLMSSLSHGIDFSNLMADKSFINLMIPLFLAVVYAILAWYLYYFPRKVLYLFSGKELPLRNFLLALIIENAFKFYL